MLCHQKDEAGMEVPKCLEMETEYVFSHLKKKRKVHTNVSSLVLMLHYI